MSSIKITDLTPVGSELFQDSESFLNELSDSEIAIVRGERGIRYQAFLKLLRQLGILNNGNLRRNAGRNGINEVPQTRNGVTVGNINTI